MIDKYMLSNDFTEIIASRLDMFDQNHEALTNGVLETYRPDYDRWKGRYRGKVKPGEVLSINSFRYRVDEIVSVLLDAVDKRNEEA